MNKNNQDFIDNKLIPFWCLFFYSYFASDNLSDEET
jgi:hypothetical protein